MALAPGTRLGPHEIVARIGTGGMGDVYRAFDPRLRRDVAIKVLPPAYAKYASRMHRFEQEARAAGALSHPNLLTIFDVGSADGKPYIVMELLDGQTLRSHMRDDGVPVRVPLRKAVDYGIQIANGLAATHERGIVHRDLKPENLFITRDGRVKILDFGVAKLRSGDNFALADDETMEQDTSPGTVIGTVGYMSPEQVRGQGVDGRSDIFSLGTVLYEMVTGEHPFRASSPADTMSAILREDPPDFSPSLQIGAGLERVILHCLEKSPEQRFQSARDLAFQLEMLSGSASSTAPAVGLARPGPWRRRAIAAGIAAALLIGGGAIGWAVGDRLRGADQAHARFSQLTYDDRLEVEPAIAPDGETFAFVRGGDIYLQRVDGRNAINLTSRCTAADGQPAFSPDGSQIAYRSECDGGGIFVMGATGESSRRINGGCFNPAWSPDGTRIVCATEQVHFTPTSRGTTSDLRILDVRTGVRRTLLQQDAVQPSWSPNGKRIAYWGNVGDSGQRDLWTIDPDAKEPVKSIVRLTNDAAVDWNPVWSHDGRWLYFGSDRNGSMNLWRMPIDERSGKARGDAEPVTTPARFSAHYSISRDGRRLLFSSVDQNETLRAVAFDPDAGAAIGTPRPIVAGSFLLFSTQLSPDGKSIAVTNRGLQEDLFVVDVATREIRQLTNDAARDRAPVWSPDGSRIYFYSQRDEQRYEIWSINADGSGLTRVTHTKGRSVWYPAVSPDGARLSFYNDHGAYVIALADPRGVQALPPGPDGLRAAMTAWSPDGLTLAGALPDVPGIALYSFADGRYRRLTTSGARPAFLPSGEILYGDAGRLRIVSPATGAIRDVAGSQGMGVMSVSGDGRTLVYSERQIQGDIWMMEL